MAQRVDLFTMVQRERHTATRQHSRCGVAVAASLAELKVRCCLRVNVREKGGVKSETVMRDNSARTFLHPC